MFAGFQGADFDAYLPHKWKSNVFNRERLEVKQKLLALGRELEASLVGADGAPLSVETSVEHPALWNHKQVDAQHLFFYRNEGSRKELDAIMNRDRGIASLIDDPTPQRNHVLLVVTLGKDGVDVGLRLHPDAKVDRQNLERRAEDHFEREKLLRLIHELPAPSRIGVLPELAPAAELDEARLEEIVGALGRAAAAVHRPGAASPQLWVGRHLPRDEAIAAAGGIVELLREALVGLLPVYLFIAWSRDNDYVSMREALQKERQARRQKGLAKNDSVRIIRGMFAGKSGVIQEIDAKGHLRVLVGKMAVKVEADDVTKL
jgi:hypothetical protein